MKQPFGPMQRRLHTSAATLVADTYLRIIISILLFRLPPLVTHTANNSQSIGSRRGCEAYRVAEAEEAGSGVTKKANAIKKKLYNMK